MSALHPAASGGIGATSAGTARGGCGLSAAPSAQGVVIRVVGKGTARESRVVRDTATRALNATPPAAVVLDLSGCDYLDSTFLGCLVHLHRAGGSADPTTGGRFTVAAPPERRGKLLGAMRLDRIVACVDTPPSTCGSWVDLSGGVGEAAPQALARHVMECHRQLAELDSPMQAVFARIADEMGRELSQ